jgi:hypothetical protein
MEGVIIQGIVDVEGQIDVSEEIFHEVFQQVGIPLVKSKIFVPVQSLVRMEGVPSL